MAATRSVQSGRQRCGPRDQAGSRKGRQLEAGVADEPRICDQQQADGQAQGGGGLTGSAALAREEDDAGHEARAEHGRGGTREDDIGEDRHDRDDGPPPTSDATGHRRDGCRHDRDVPAGDRDDVTHAGRREGRREVTIHEIAEADEDAGRQPCLRLGQDSGKGCPGPASKVLERPAWVLR